eukprot:gene11367-biopygen1431
MAEECGAGSRSLPFCMWTEPVALGILSTLFPTVRAWPRGTTEMVIAGIHALLDGVGLSDNDWGYCGANENCGGSDARPRSSGADGVCAHIHITRNTTFRGKYGADPVVKWVPGTFELVIQNNLNLVPIDNS